MIQRLNQLSEEVMDSISAHFDGEGIAHCDRCNSQVPHRNLMRRDWRWKPGPACPNCAAMVNLWPDTNSEPVLAPQPSLGQERFCPNCGGAYQYLVTDVRSGEERPTRYCPHCGRSLMRHES